MSALSSRSSNNIDLSASLVNFSGLFRGQFKDILKYSFFSCLRIACSSSGEVQFWVYDQQGPDFKTCKAWCFLIRSFELNLSRDKPDLWHWELHGRWTWQCQKFHCEPPDAGDSVWVKGVSLSFLPQKQRWGRQQGVAFAVGPRLCLVHGLAAALAIMRAWPRDSSMACPSLFPTWQMGRVRGKQEKYSPSRGVGHTSRKEGPQEEPGCKLKPCSGKGARSVL